MTTVITGAGGFVGRHLIRELRASSKRKDALYGISVDTITGQTAEELNGVEHIDITDYNALRSCLLRINPDSIYHLAAQSSVALSFREPINTFQVNQIGTLNVLEIAVNDLDKHPRILLVGSADIYANVPDGKPIGEETSFNPMNPYAASKAGMDFLGQIYWSNHGLHTIRTRSFNHIGSGQSTVFVIPNFARQIAKIEKGLQEPVLKVGNIQVQRDFTDVRDVVRAYRLIMEMGHPGEVYNVCSNRSYPISELLQMMLSMSMCSIDVREDPERMRPSDNPILLGDYTKLNKHTGWKPEIPLAKTLEDLLNYWREIVEYENN